MTTPQNSQVVQSPQAGKLKTPCVVIDDTIVHNNLTRAQQYFDHLGVDFRPHIKTHKIPAIAQRQIALGAVGINCQKISEAKPFAQAGIRDILITYNIIGDDKLADLYDLAKQCDLKITADSKVCVDGLAKTFANASHPLTVLVECDTGMGRCGVQFPEQAHALACHIYAQPGLTFGGLMTYPAPHTERQATAFLATAKGLIEQDGIPVPIVTTGGTPCLYTAENNTVMTEYRAGTYIYCDRSLVSAGMCTFADCALTVQATVVSVPHENRCIIDAGSKALTSDLLNQIDYGHIRQFPEAKIITLSEEHGTVDISSCPKRPAIGDVVNIIPNHCCVVTNLFDHVHYVQKGRVIATYDVSARGCVF